MNYQMLVSTYNALMSVETRGQSSIIMADCLRNIANIISAMEQEQARKNAEEANAEEVEEK